MYVSEKEVGTHSSTLAWKIPWPEEGGGLPFTGTQRVGHDLVMKQQQQIRVYAHSGILLSHKK